MTPWVSCKLKKLIGSKRNKFDSRIFICSTRNNNWSNKTVMR